MTDVYNLVIYHNYLGAPVMAVRTEHGVTMLCGLDVPKRVNLVDGDRHRHDGRVAATFDVDSLRRRGMEDFARRINGIVLPDEPDLGYNPLTPDTLPPSSGDLQ